MSLRLIDYPQTAPMSAAHIVDAVGADEFPAVALHNLNDLWGIDIFTIYRISGPRPEMLCGISTEYPCPAECASRVDQSVRSYRELHLASAAAQSRQVCTMLREDVHQLVDPSLAFPYGREGVVDRIILCGQRTCDVYALSLLRTRSAGMFRADDLKGLASSAEILLSTCAKHASLRWMRQPLTNRFNSVARIDQSIGESDWKLPKREREVAARLIYGMSVLGISLELGLEEDTVATYRKRLYQRLNISSRHELLLSYVEQIERSGLTKAL